MSFPDTPASRPELSPRSLLIALWKHRFAGIALAGLVATAGIVIVRHLPAVYEAGALILVDPQKIPDRFVSSTISEDFTDRLATMNQEILSATRLRMIIAELNPYASKRKKYVMDEIVEMMRKDIKVSVEKSLSGNRPTAFRITYQAPDPLLAARVVDRITKLYIDENVKNRELQSEGTSEFLEAQLREAKRTLDEQEAAVSRYKLQHNGELPEQENELAGVLSRLQVQLDGTQEAMNRAQQSKLTLESAITSSQAVEDVMRNRTRVFRLPGEETVVSAASSESVPESAVLAAQLENARLRYGDMHPDVRRLRDQFAAAREREQSSARGPAVPGTSAATKGNKAIDATIDPEVLRAHEHTVQLGTELAAMREEISQRRDERERIVREIASYEQRIQALPLREQEYARLTRDYDFSKTNYRVLLDKKMAAEMATDLEKRQKAERFRVLDPAKPPQRPIKPKRMVLYAVSLGVGLILGILMSVLLEMRRGVLLGEWELPASTPVLARISRIDRVPGGDAIGNESARTLSGLALRSVFVMALLVVRHRLY